MWFFVDKDKKSDSNDLHSKFKEGDRVYHSKKFGLGEVLKNNYSTSTVDVIFDDPTDGKIIRTMSETFLEHSDVPKKYRGESFKIGDNVYNSIYGEGTVVNIINKYISSVSFDSQQNYIDVLNSELELIDKDIIENDELEDELIDSSFSIIPSNYSAQHCYTTTTKRILTFLRKTYKDEGFATMKSYVEDNGVVGVMCLPSKGIVVFKSIEVDIPIQILQTEEYSRILDFQLNALKEYYLDRFYKAKNLCELKGKTQKVLKYPVRFVILLQKVDLNEISPEDRNKIYMNNKNIYFKNFTSIFEDNDVFSSYEKYDDNFEKIDPSLYGAIIERVIPENATLINVLPEEPKNVVDIVNPTFLPITGEEREFKALSLEDEEIKIINDTKSGHYLTLANPGTGKSVILISKAYRIFSKNNKANVLITCYNKNLADHHRQFAQISGFKGETMHIETFHKFVLNLLNEYEGYTYRYDEDNSDKLDEAIDRLDYLLKSGKIKTNLNAIFIDEVQLFEPKWIDICYRLLDRRQGKEFFFEMYGDINQDVKTQRSKGKASWQNTKEIPPLNGRVRKLNKNYRNTELIANYLKCMITEFNEYLSKHGSPVDLDCACLTSETVKKGTMRTKILFSPAADCTKIIKIINELITKKKADYSDIAIIYPARGYGKYYQFQNKLISALNYQNMPYSLIHGNYTYGPNQRKSIFSSDGIILSTIESCLGLDFKYVILAGIHYWDFYHDDKSPKTFKLTKQGILFNEKEKVYFNEIGKQIYSACSRARDGLFIINDLDKDSPIREILTPTSGRKYFDYD